MATVAAPLAFTPSKDVSPDSERPGLLRARTYGPQEPPEAMFDFQTCRLEDWCAIGPPKLLKQGFGWADLSPFTEVQAVLARIRAAGRAEPEDAREIRRRLSGQWLRLGDGTRLRVLSVAPEGFILRKGGPNGMPVNAPGAMTEMNDHDVATAIHADQDVAGTPLRQMMRGAAPWLFRHDAPDSRNRWSPLELLNFWIPLQQITRPLVLMDKRTLDRRAHQLRYGLPTDAFLDRDEAKRVNDIWTFLHDEKQRWYFGSELGPDRAYVFETLGTPHGSCILPGEDIAEDRYRRLEAALAAIECGEVQALERACAAEAWSASQIGTLPLHRAIEAMDALLVEAARDAAVLCERATASDWSERARRAMDPLVRRSVEMRVVALRAPRFPVPG